MTEVDMTTETEDEVPAVPLEGLHSALDASDEDKVSLESIAVHLHEEGLLFWMLVFTALPALPLPVPPGVNILIALPVLWVALQVSIGRDHLWVPAWLGRRQFKRTHVMAGVRYIQKIMKKLQGFSRYRLRWLLKRKAQQLQGVLWFICGLSIAIPLPFSNTTPSLGILISACGILLSDGLIVLGGMGICFAGIGLTTAMLIAGKHVLENVPFF